MEFVSFEIAKKLKEKGFIEECFANYRYSNKDYLEKNSYNPDTGNVFYCYNTDEDLSQFYIDAPTISQVLEWLREECGIFILVEPDILSPEYKLTFTLRVKFYIKGEEDEGFSEKYLTYRRDSYELAALAGIEYVLNNLI